MIGGFLLVMVSTALSFAMSKITEITNRLSGQTQTAQGNSTGKVMLWTMPLMSLWIGFSMPAALCVYWIANSVFTMGQELIAAKMLRKDYEAARLAAEERAKQRLAKFDRERVRLVAASEALDLLRRVCIGLDPAAEEFGV